MFRLNKFGLAFVQFPATPSPHQQQTYGRDEEEMFLYDMAPRALTNHRGEPHWDLSEAKPLLEKDIIEPFLQTTTLALLFPSTPHVTRIRLVVPCISHHMKVLRFCTVWLVDLLAST
jgi:hypothetical protein